MVCIPYWLAYAYLMINCLTHQKRCFSFTQHTSPLNRSKIANMRKMDSLLNHKNLQNSQLGALTQQLQSHQLLQRFWLAACPQLLSQLSTVGSLNNGQLTIFAHSPIVANKIKLTQAKLLTQLQLLQNTVPAFRDCKVTAISVKVQVISHPKAIVPLPRKLSEQAAISLKKLAQDLGESPLATQLKSLADKT